MYGPFGYYQISTFFGGQEEHITFEGLKVICVCGFHMFHVSHELASQEAKRGMYNLFYLSIKKHACDK